MAQPVKVRRLTDQEGQKLQRIVRRGSTGTVRYRRAMMLPASAGGNSVPVIARLVQADEDTVRDVIHRFNEIGLACLDPQWAGGRPRLLTPDHEDFVVATATTRPRSWASPSPAGQSGNSPTTGPRRGNLTGIPRPTTAPTEPPTSTVATRSATTPCGASTADAGASPPPGPHYGRSERPVRTEPRST